MITPYQNLCDWKDRNIEGWASATSPHRRRWTKSLALYREKGEERLPLYLVNPEFKSCPDIFWVLWPQTFPDPVCLSLTTLPLTLPSHSEDDLTHFQQVNIQHCWNLNVIISAHRRGWFSFYPLEQCGRPELEKSQMHLRTGWESPVWSKEELQKHLHLLSVLLPRQKEQKHPSHSLEKSMIKGTYADVAVTSCQPLAMFCFSSCSELIPSFRLISARCFSFAANTWDRVWISSSTYEKGGWGKNTARVIQKVKTISAKLYSKFWSHLKTFDSFVSLKTTYSMLLTGYMPISPVELLFPVLFL